MTVTITNADSLFIGCWYINQSFITPFIYIELSYGALQSTKVLCTLHSIFNFKSKMIDPNRSI
jgi:hypothetical protein